MQDFQVIDGDLCGSPTVELSDVESDFDDCESICSLWDLTDQLELVSDSIWGDCCM